MLQNYWQGFGKPYLPYVINNEREYIMLNIKKRVVSLNGTVVMPLKTKEKAVIYFDGGTIKTSLVVAIKEVSKDLIVFETLNSIYRVIPEFVPEIKVMDVTIPVCA